MVNIILAEGCDDLLTEGKVATVLDMACGTGGMLSTTFDFLHRLNPTIDVRLFGQEINPESYAICLADMLIKGQDAGNIRFQDTMMQDCFPDQSMRIVIANPPFGTPWGGKDAPEGVEKAIRNEYHYVDDNVPVLQRMFNRRLKGHKALRFAVDINEYWSNLEETAEHIGVNKDTICNWIEGG
jgi:type I restriction enzyme M protein